MAIFNHILRILVGLTFIFSGLAKLFPIERFEIVFVDLGISNWLLAPFIARFIIAFEITLGLCIVFDVWLRNVIYKVALGSLGVFMAYLIFLLVTKGNVADCGCLGSYLPLTPVESLVKNVILVLMLLFIKRRHHQHGIINWLIIPFLIIAFTATFLLNRVGLQNTQAIEINEEVNYSAFPPLYKSGEQVDFSKGKKVIAFLSHACPHCESAAHKLHYLQTQYDIDNLYVVLASKKEENVHVFIEKTKIDYPMVWFDNDTFFSYSGGRLPAIVYIEDGVLKKKWIGEFFKVEELEEVLSKK